MILLADHAQTPVHRGLPLAELLGREWTVLQPSESEPEPAQLAVSPTGRAAYVYLLPGEGERADPEALREALTVIEGVDLVCRLEDAGGQPLVRTEPGAPRDGLRAPWSNGARRRLSFRPGRRRSPICAAAAGSSTATWRRWRRRSRTASCAARPTPIRSPASGRRSALPTPAISCSRWQPGFEAVDWGGVTHAGGGSHGSLHAGDSLGPLLFVGCGPGDASEREQWTLRDVAPAVLEHFGLEVAGGRACVRCLPCLPASSRASGACESRPPRRRLGSPADDPNVVEGAASQRRR